MSIAQKTSYERNETEIKEFVYNREQELIRHKTFLDAQRRPIFLDDIEIANGKPNISQSDIWQILNDLKTAPDGRDEFIIFENPLHMTEPTLPKYYIRSRIYHTVWCLYASVNIRRGGGAGPYGEERDVGDIQFIRYIKRRPKISNSFDDIFNNSDTKNILKHPKQKIFQDALKAMRNDSEMDITKISNFQLNSTNIILKNLAEPPLDRWKKKKTQGITIVAGTGWGKSFAYQFPLLLWILKKKIEKYDQSLQNPDPTVKPQVNCSAILIFPRNALAQDQYTSLNTYIKIINRFIDSDKTIPAKKKKFLKIKNIVQDYGSKVTGKLDEVYGTDPDKGNPDIIITSPESLTRRLLDPTCHQVYKNGIDLVLLDEVHLWQGLHGSYICSLMARLRNILEYHNKAPLFVGMSATIANPESHCQKLFSLDTANKPIVITQEEDDDTERYSTEYHLMLKPRSGRNSNGVAINTLSCLIHNRRIGLNRDGMTGLHPERATGERKIDTKEKEKSITFIDSLNTTSKFTNDLNNYEFFTFPNHKPGQNPVRQYLIFNRPEERVHRIGHACQQVTAKTRGHCDNCIDRTMPMMLDCDSYRDGKCWYYSQDDANYFAINQYGNWPTPFQGRVEYPRDNIRSIRVSSQEETPEDKYDYFRSKEKINIFDPQDPDDFIPDTPYGTEIDNIVATSSVEVGVDFKKIKEIIQYGDIRSPTSYKQKAGRGAREGNDEDGLFVMSVIHNTPQGHSRFKHFKRLVDPSLDPIKLNTTNPFIIKSQCFCSVFDFIAMTTNIFKIENLSESTITKNFKEVEKILQSKKLEYYLEQFTKLHSSFNQKIITETIKESKKIFKELSKQIELEVNPLSKNAKKIKMSLHEWFSGMGKSKFFNAIDTEYGSDDQKQYDLSDSIKTEMKKIRDISKKSPNHEEIKKLLDSIPGVLK